MGRMAVLICALALLAGCGSVVLWRTPSPEEIAEANKTPEQRWTERWLGKSEDDVMLAYGVPDKTGELSTGNRLIDYHREGYSSRGFGYVNQYGGGSGSRGDTYFCDRRFEIGKDSRRVLRATISGNRCDYKR